jgi:hypothetical protein
MYQFFGDTVFILVVHIDSLKREFLSRDCFEAHMENIDFKKNYLN